MLEYYRLYLPLSKREVKIEVSVPRIRQGITFDTVYFLDGQNAFKDSHASYGRSLRAAKTLGIAAKEMGKRILGVAVYNSESDLGRINEYTPFRMDTYAYPEWKKHDVQFCMNYFEDFIHTIIPFIEKKYTVHKSENHRAIYGSSLGAIAAIYLALGYENSFRYVGAFSTPGFLFEEKFMSFIEEKVTKKKEIFLYVGKQEQSDDIYDKSVYLNSSYQIYDLLKKKKIRTRMSIDANGIHNEENWGNHIIDFINFIYFDDVFFKL